MPSKTTLTLIVSVLLNLLGGLGVIDPLTGPAPCKPCNCVQVDAGAP